MIGGALEAAAAFPSDGEDFFATVGGSSSSSSPMILASSVDSFLVLADTPSGDLPTFLFLPLSFAFASWEVGSYVKKISKVIPGIFQRNSFSSSETDHSHRISYRNPSLLCILHRHGMVGP